MSPFEISKEMIADLGDENLRSLLNSLLEAEATRRGIPLSCIAVGGNQTAGDGGVDASIQWTASPPPRGWLPRRTIYFQSKAEVMAPKKLRAEMRPDNVPRPIFSQLAADRGAYIVFTTNDVTNSGYQARISAMRSAIADVPQASRVQLDFYGADRIARWTNEFPGVSAGLLEQVGRSVRGWQPYGSWSAANRPQTSYFHDTEARAHLGGNPVEVTAAITAMRRALQSPGGAVRLVGISGMGKTRLAEALFDPAIDPETALPQSLAIYGDAGTELTVGSALLAEQLVASGIRAIIVVDNCSAQLHAQLTAIIGRTGSHSSLLTIDYDVGGEQLGATLIVSLGDNSENVLEAVLNERFPALSSMDRSHVASFAGGNARVALKIAEGAEVGVSLAALNDSELLGRLFQTGRQEQDASARRCAEAASLVYAFYLEPADGHEAELDVLATLAGISPNEFFRQIAIFLDWGIVQQRGPQRAVMPPPIANMLAADAIRRIPQPALIAAMVGASPRLFTSFARRLGFLHHVAAASSLASLLFSPNGLLGRPAHLNENSRNAFVAAAPAAPADALAAIERTLAGDDRDLLIAHASEGREDFAELLVNLAYDSTLFVRAMSALVEFVLAESEGGGSLSVADLFLERFWIVLSFTQADVSTRLTFIDGLLDDDDPQKRQLGIRALARMLKTSHFSSSRLARFGTRPQSDEWRPNAAEQREWFAGAFQRLTAFALGNDVHVSDRARSVIAGNVREHLYAGYPELMLDALEAITGGGHWEEGWRAVNEGLSFERDGLNKARLARLDAIEEALRPASLRDFFETFVLGEPWRHWHPTARHQRHTRKAGLLARATGKRLVRSGSSIAAFLQEALEAEGANSVFEFARGIGQTTHDLGAEWLNIMEGFAAVPEEKRRAAMLSGFLAGANTWNAAWTNDALDDAIDDPLLSPFLVDLHAGVALDARAMDRFSQALAKGVVRPASFAGLMYGGATKPVPAADLARFLAELFAVDEGVQPALEVLHMRMYGDRTDNKPIAPELLDLGRRMITDPRTYEADFRHSDLGIETIARIVVKGPDGEEVASQICRALRNRPGSNRYRHRDFDGLCRELAKLHPRVVLDEIVAIPESSDDLIWRFFGGPGADNDVGTPAYEGDDATILAWVAVAPQDRAGRIARFIRYQLADDGTGEIQWSPLALSLIEASPDPVRVLNAFEHRFYSGASSGPISARFARRRPLLAALANHADRSVRNWVRQAQQRLEDDIARWNEIDRERESRFEY